MPTKKKRVGFIPRDDVIKIIDQLSIENNLSNSKIISILVEEALSLRGIFNKKTGKVNKSYQEIKESTDYISNDSADLKGIEKYAINTKFINKSSFKQTLSNEPNGNSIDLQTYKKFLSFLKFQELMDEFST